MRTGRTARWPRNFFRLWVCWRWHFPALSLPSSSFLSSTESYKTETAIRYTMAESVSLSGVVAFDTVDVAGSGNLGYLVQDGERVTNGTVVAKCYTDDTQGFSVSVLTGWGAPSRCLPSRRILRQRAFAADQPDGRRCTTCWISWTQPSTAASPMRRMLSAGPEPLQISTGQTEGFPDHRRPCRPSTTA